MHNNKEFVMWNIIVTKSPSGRTWEVRGVVRSKGVNDFLEGGFFTREAAENCRARWERQCIQDEVEKAECAAGWDPNP